jgi:hypothetical protein
MQLCQKLHVPVLIVEVRVFTGCGKRVFVVIPSEARDPLFRKCQEKSRSLGQSPPSG